MALISINTGGASGFLYNNWSGNARLCITAETPDFDTHTLQSWKDEGFNVIYIAYNNGGKEYIQQLKSVKEGLGVGDNYAVIAFGDAASFCLDYYQKPINASRLCTLVAYYPTDIPDTRLHFPPSLNVVTHLAGNTVDVITQPTVVGLQGKKRRTTRRIQPGMGTGERLYIGHNAYTYEYAQPGFAEYDLEEYDRLACELAFTRTFQLLRKGLGKAPDLEEKWDEHQEGKFFSSDVSETMEPFAHHVTPIVTYTPTQSGGIGEDVIRRFYEQNFIRKLPPSMRLRLISRTVGVNRIVDELHALFDHTHEIPWMLPGVPPTNKKVEIIIVSIASMKAGRLSSEHIYWDQASVLVQVGLLDPKLVPRGVHGVDRLPVVGRDAARRILQENPETEEEYHNRLIRRARAKSKRNGQAGSVEESGTEIKSEAEKPMEPSKSKGKSVQKESKPTEKDEGEETETESHEKKNGSASAYVEDENGNDDA